MSRSTLLKVFSGLIFTTLILFFVIGPSDANTTAAVQDTKPVDPPRKVVKSNAEWKKILTPEQYTILREKGTERAGSSPLNHNKEKGVYYCAACHNALFSSDTKFESGTGWPSFFRPITKNAVHESKDLSYGMVRTEVECSVCGGHLGHVFEDGPEPTGLRYCMNGIALKFEKK